MTGSGSVGVFVPARVGDVDVQLVLEFRDRPVDPRGVLLHRGDIGTQLGGVGLERVGLVLDAVDLFTEFVARPDEVVPDGAEAFLHLGQLAPLSLLSCGNGFKQGNNVVQCRFGDRLGHDFTVPAGLARTQHEPGRSRKGLGVSDVPGMMTYQKANGPARAGRPEQVPTNGTRHPSNTLKDGRK